MEPPKHQDYQLLPHRIDWLSQNVPAKVFAKYPKRPNNVQDGLETVTFKDLATAIDRAAWWLTSNLKPEEEVFAYSGPADLRWSALLVAAIKTGKSMLHATPWARVDDWSSLFLECNCSVVIYEKDERDCNLPTQHPFAQLEERQSWLRSLETPILSEWFGASQSTDANFKYVGIWDERADDVVAVFHTIGNTGALKTISWSNRRIAHWESLLDLARTDQSILVPEVLGKNVFTAFSPASVQGHNLVLFMPLFFGNTVVLKHPEQELEPETVREIMTMASCEGIVAPTGLLHELARHPNTLGLLRSTETIVGVGTGMTEECHNRLRHPGVRVQNLYGRAEVFPCLQHRATVMDPHYLRFHEAEGADFLPHSSGHMELVVQQNTQGSLGSRDAVHRTGDLFSRHATMRDRWLFQGRVDDRITLASGDEISTSELEGIISEHPLVKSALVYGNSRPRPLLVIEPWSDAMASLNRGDFKEQFLEEIWPFVEQANGMHSGINRLDQHLTVVMRTPVVRFAEQSIDRHRTAAHIKEEVDELYATYTKPSLSQPKARVESVKSARTSVTRGEQLQRNLRCLQAFREMGAVFR